MRKTHKFLSIILAIMMVISIIPITASAETITGTCGDDATWTYNTSNGYLTISGTGAMYDYKSNNRPWESYEDKIKNVFIDNGITKIGNYAFYSCENIINIELPSTVIVIGDSAFCSCKKLSTITIPYGVTTIEYRAFGSCISLTNVTMPNSITTIGQNAFISCTSLTNITIPDSVITIEKTAFVHCENLLSIIVDENNQYYSNDKYGVLFNKDKTTLIYYPGGCIKTNYTVPEGTLTIGDSAFVYAYKLISVTFADSVIRIGKYAFDGCDKLTTVIIPDSVTEIGYSAFVEWSHEPSGNLTDVYYTGTEEQWKLISIDDWNDRLINATIHYNHAHNYNSVITPPTCTEQGYTTYTCECNNAYIDDYVEALGHDMIIDEAVSPDCVNTGLTEGSHCSRCDDATTEQEIVSALGHSHDTVTTPPTCTEQGYTTHTCECGDSYIDDYVDATGHSHISKITTPATHITTGVETFTCVCGDSYTEVIEKVAEHNHETVVTAPTCTEQGYTTYTCECGDTYIDNYVDATGHNYESVITPPNCTEQGYTMYTCECGDSYVDDYVNAIGHTYGEWVVTKEATVDVEGEMERVCYCGEKEYKGIEKLPPVDNEDEDVENPDIPNTSSNVASFAYSVFMLITFTCAIASLLFVRRRRCK